MKRLFLFGLIIVGLTRLTRPAEPFSVRTLWLGMNKKSRNTRFLLSGGERGIRTLGPGYPGQRFSRPPRSTAPASLLKTFWACKINYFISICKYIEQVFANVVTFVKI